MTPPAARPRRIVATGGKILYLADRLPKRLYPDRMAELGQALEDRAGEPGIVIAVAFGAETRSERERRLRQGRDGWSRDAIRAVMREDEARGVKRR